MTSTELRLKPSSFDHDEDWPWRAWERSYDRHGQSMTRALGLSGWLCWLMVLLTHVAKRWQLFPGMGWGLPNSPGHYLDLFTAIGGTALLLAAFLTPHFSK
jgi:hypothetical protein